MAITLAANYAKKLGLPNYSSHQYSVTIRTELSDLSQAEEESGRLYRLLQDAVDREIQEAGFMPDATRYGMNVPAITPPETAVRATAKIRMDGNAAKSSAPEKKSGRSIRELITTVSASRLSCWQQCRLKFQFRYVAGLEKPATPARHVGTTVHAVLQQWNLARWRHTPLDETALREIFEQAWAVLQEDRPGIDFGGEEAECKASAWKVLETYFRGNSDSRR